MAPGRPIILELISACAHHLGLSAGINIPRGNPFQDPDHSFSLELYLAVGVSSALDSGFGQPGEHEAWDRTLKLTSARSNTGHSQTITAGAIEDPHRSVAFAREAVSLLQATKEVHYLSLDSDRAYPKRRLPTQELVQAFETKWESIEYTRGRTFVPTKTLYEEWLRYCLARENKAANKFYQDARRAREEGRPAPSFEDAFGTYRASLRTAMPHLVFAGVGLEDKSILFDTAGLELWFDQLSGGEREIAFLVGQIDRFGLKNGIFLLDEPELHLNPDLVRSWVTYLAGSVATGQVWLATHSLEAVEAAGQSATFLLERNPETKLVDKVGPIAGEPVLSALSRAVGTPAFSVSALRFIFVEGEEAIGERERFRRIFDLGVETRVIECGSCTEVLRRVSAIKSLAEESGQHIRSLG